MLTLFGNNHYENRYLERQFNNCPIAACHSLAEGHGARRALHAGD